MDPVVLAAVVGGLVAAVLLTRRRGTSSTTTPLGIEEALALDVEEWIRRILAAQPAGRFEEPRLVGQGGMARLYRVRDTRLDRDVVFKLMDPESFADPDMRRRFLREARALAAMSAPGLPAVYDVSEAPVPYFVMQFLEGSSLAERIAEAGRLAPADVRRWTAAAARALAHAHEAGIVHRDVKPENLMVDAKGVAWVVDFGVASVASAAPITTVGQVVGTPDFLAPERVRGAEPDARMDVFSLAATAWFLLGGRMPYTVAQLVHEGDYRPHPLPEDVPADLVAVLEAGLEMDPDERIQTMTEFAARLEA